MGQLLKTLGEATLSGQTGLFPPKSLPTIKEPVLTQLHSECGEQLVDQPPLTRSDATSPSGPGVRGLLSHQGFQHCRSASPTAHLLIWLLRKGLRHCFDFSFPVVFLCNFLKFS